MGKKRGVYRMSVSVPWALRQRMVKVGDVLNWSAIAAEAFEQKLREIELKKEVPHMDEVVNKFRHSQREDEEDSYKAGFEAGQEWAERKTDQGGATAAEMRRLSRFREKQGPDWEGWFEGLFNMAYSCSECLACEIRGVGLDRDTPREFWELALGEGEEAEGNQDNVTFLRGFAEGALDVWDKVKGQL